MLTPRLVVDLFAGPGGWDEGLRYAGYTGRLVGIEHDLTACRTAMAAGHQRICADVATYPTAPFEDRVDGLIASPPCQAWSMAGDRKGQLDQEAVYRRIAAFAAGREPETETWADERSLLTAEPMRWAAALRPRGIALEQVPPVLPLWQYTAALLARMGYRTWTGVLSAEEYGVPQTRRRAILIARRDGLPAGMPTPTHQRYRSGRPAETEGTLFAPLPPPVSMADALGWAEVWQYERQAHGGQRPETAPSLTITASIDNGNLRWALRNGNQANACERRMDEPAGTLYFGARTNAVDWVQTRPATTVCGDARLGAPGHRDREGGEKQFGEGSVRITVQEAGILQSFPADYPWQGNKSQQYQQCGNAVPPLLAAAILRPLLAEARERAA